MRGRQVSSLLSSDRMETLNTKNREQYNKHCYEPEKLLYKNSLELQDDNRTIDLVDRKVGQ